MNLKLGAWQRAWLDDNKCVTLAGIVCDYRTPTSFCNANYFALATAHKQATVDGDRASVALDFRFAAFGVPVVETASDEAYRTGPLYRSDAIWRRTPEAAIGEANLGCVFGTDNEPLRIRPRECRKTAADDMQAAVKGFGGIHHDRALRRIR